LNLFDHNGTPMESDPVFGRLLTEKKAFFQGLAEMCGRPGRYRGVQLLHHPDASSVKRLSPGSDYSALNPGQHACMEQLEALGVSTTYDEEEVVSASGQVVRALSKKRVRRLLEGGLLLDGVAARALVDRGFGKEIGLKKVGNPRFLFDIGPYHVEEFFHTDLGGEDRTYLVALFGPHMGPPFCELKPAKDAMVIGRFVDPDTERGPASMIAYENELGGRIVVQGFDLEHGYGDNYCRPERVRQIQGAVRWLSRGNFPMMINGPGAWPLAFRKDFEESTVLGFFNLSLDPWPEVRFELNSVRDPVSIQKLGSDGVMRDCESIGLTRAGEQLSVEYSESVAHGEPLFLSMKW
jgi:hypothetical protein